MKKAWIPDNAKAFTGMTGKALCCVALGVNVLYAGMGVAKYGSQHIDAYGIWMVKARAIQIEQGIPLSFLRNPQYAYSHQQYPLLLPWLMATIPGFLWLYLVGYVLVLVMLFVLTKSLFWTTMASFMGPLIAQGGRGHAGLADLWICLAVAVALWATRNRKIWIVALSVMIASQIKTEGIFLLSFLLFFEVSWRPKLIWFLVSVTPFIGWQLAVLNWGIQSDFGLRLYPFAELLTRFGELIGAVGKEMFNWRNWYVVWGVVWLQLWRGQPRGIAPTRRILGIMVVGYAFVYVFSTLPIEAYVGSSVDRIMLQLLPLWFIPPHIPLLIPPSPIAAVGHSRRGQGKVFDSSLT